MGNLTKSQSNNIASPDGNGLAIYVDGITGALMLKDINGKVQPLSGYVPSTPITSPFEFGTNPTGIKPVLGNNGAYAPCSTIHGGRSNSNSSTCGTILGGRSNNNGGASNFIGGGCVNSISIDPNTENSTILGGCCNIIQNENSVILGGYYNQSLCGKVSAVPTCNIAIGGGSYNQASDYISTVIGGYNNGAQGNYGFVGGGCCNGTDDTIGNTIFGGVRNKSTNYGCFGTVLGGKSITNNSVHGVALGGSSNQLFGSNNVIGTGCNHSVCGNNNFIGGGLVNHNYSPNGSFIGGGIFNNLIGNFCFSVIVGGCYNNLNQYQSNNYNFIGGGRENRAINNSTVVNGYKNCVDSNLSIIFSGVYNSHSTSSNYSIIGVGYNNDLLASSSNSGILSGQSNSISNAFNFIGGGASNQISSYCFSTILGGNVNRLNSSHSFIGSGNNVCTDNNANFSVVLNGYCNAIKDSNSFMHGGECNTTELGYANVILGGKSNLAQQEVNFISGNQNIASYRSSILGCYNISNICGACNNIIGHGITADRRCTTFINNLSIKNLPLNTCAGLPAGSVWAYYKVGTCFGQAELRIV